MRSCAQPTLRPAVPRALVRQGACQHAPERDGPLADTQDGFAQQADRRAIVGVHRHDGARGEVERPRSATVAALVAGQSFVVAQVAIAA